MATSQGTMERVTIDVLAAQSIDMSTNEIRRVTNEWISAHEGEEGQLNAVIDLLNHGSDRNDTLHQIILEAWSVLISRKLWQSRYNNQEEAMKAIDNPILKDIRISAAKGRKRRDLYITRIKKEWGDETKEWAFHDLSENHARAISLVAAQYAHGDAITMVVQIASARLKDVRSGRGSSRDLNKSDWMKLMNIGEERARELLLLPLPDEEELASIGTDLTRLRLPQRRQRSQEPESPEKPMKRMRFQRRIRKEKSPEAIFKPITAERTNDTESPALSDSEGESSSENESSDEEETINSSQIPKHKRCTCEGISTAILDRLMRDNPEVAGITSDTDCLDLLSNINGKRGLQKMCYFHLKALGGKIGLQVKSLNKPKLVSRVRRYWENRQDINAFKVHEETTNWWRIIKRPQTEADKLGVYQWKPCRQTLLETITERRAKALVEHFAGPEAWSTWEETGNIIVSGLFSWMWEGVDSETGIGELIDQEFNMYLHHQTERNGASNKGWLRIMCHSLSQSIIRQDLTYWALYSCLRPDRNCHLVSYLYYTKFVTEGDSTWFRHIDMSIPPYLATGHGGNIIQGSVSIDNESEKGCTEIVPGFHRNIRAWWERKIAGGETLTGGAIHAVDKIWTKKDSADYGDFIPIPCRRGDARITRPEIPHGSTTNGGDGVRRTVLPWYVAVREDGETLDNEESDTWSNLAVAYASQQAVKLTPSGYTNRYGTIPFRFPASTHLNLTSPVSQAIVCKASWDDPSVQVAARVLLGPDRERADRVIKEARIEALKVFKVAFSIVRAAEKLYYGANSYFESGVN